MDRRADGGAVVRHVAVAAVQFDCQAAPTVRARPGPDIGAGAEAMTLALAELLLDGGERIVHLTGDGESRRAVSGRLAVGQIADIIAGEIIVPPPADGASFPKFSARLPRHATVVLISDFLA